MHDGEIDDIVRTSSEQVVEHYVFPDIAKRLAGVLGDSLAAGRYHGIDEPATLAALVTDDLQSVNADRHLRLKFHADPLPDLASDELMDDEVRRTAQETMAGIARMERLPPWAAGDAVSAAMCVVSHADALILDLRCVVGGNPHGVAVVCSYLFDDEPVHLNDLYERAGERTTQFWTLPYLPGPRFGAQRPVYVLTSASTFSGGEELAYDLQQLGRATVVGERTGGGAHPRMGVRKHPHLELTVPTGRAVNPVSGTNWEGVGVIPDLEVPAERAQSVAFDAITAQRAAA